MIIKTVELETVAGVTTKRLPVHTLPEIAFAGRSNVGKSSLINALVGRSRLARVSSTPGKTQTINFYNINSQFYMVDLPGYGYARVAVDFRKSWGPMIESFLNNSTALKALFLLIDCRRTPNDDDRLMYEWARAAGLRTIVIMTKCDKLKRSQLSAAGRNISEALDKSGNISVVMFSALKKTGIEDIHSIIDTILQETS